MKKLLLLLLLSSSTLAHEYIVYVETNVFGLLFDQSTLLNNGQKQLIRDDFQIVLSRFAITNYILAPSESQGQGGASEGALCFVHAPEITPWKYGDMLYKTINSTNYLLVDDEICHLYTNAFVFTNEHAMQVQQLPGFINRYNNIYTNKSLTDQQRLQFLWNPKVMALVGNETNLRLLLDSYTPTNQTADHIYAPSILEYRIVQPNELGYTNVPLLFCRTSGKRMYRGKQYISPADFVFVDGAWRLLLPYF